MSYAAVVVACETLADEMPGDRPPSSPAPDEHGEDPPARADGGGSGGASAWPDGEAAGVWALTPPASPPGPPQVPRTYPALGPSPTFDAWRRWPPPPTDTGGAGPADPQGNPWLVVLTVVVAVTILALVAIGLRAVDEPKPRYRNTASAPGRSGVLPTTGPSSGPVVPRSNWAPSVGPVIPANAPWDVDMTPPTVRVDDPVGQLGMLVPDTWEGPTAPEPTVRQWQLPVRTFPPASGLLLIGFNFTVSWGAPSSCDLAECAARLVEALQSSGATVAPTLQSESVGGEHALRIDATAPAERVAAWVVVLDDRYWITMLSGPTGDFDEMLAAVRPVLATMAFG